MFPVEFNSYIDQLEYLLNVHHLTVPAEVVEKIGIKTRLICTINNSLSFQCGMVALGEGRAYITVNNARMKKLKIKHGDEVAVKLEKDDSKYGMPVPAELQELLRQDDEGLRRFEALPKGMQRYIIFYVSGVKSSQLRIDRAIFLIENLKKTTEGKETFREILGKV